MTDLVAAVTIGSTILGAFYTLVQVGDRLWGKKDDPTPQAIALAATMQQLMDASVRLIESTAKLNHAVGNIANSQTLHAKDGEYRYEAVAKALSSIEGKVDALLRDRE